jgi:hypothetical protein
MGRNTFEITLYTVEGHGAATPAYGTGYPRKPHRRWIMDRHTLSGFAIALCFMPLTSMAEGHPTLHVDSFGGSIHVTLGNAGDQSIKVRNDFLVDPVVGALTLKFVHGKTSHSLLAQINPELPSDETYSVLAPGQEIGQAFDYPIIRGLYSLKPGCYSVRAVYHDSVAEQFGGTPRKLVSNTSKVCVVRAGKSFELRVPGQPARSAEGH